MVREQKPLSIVMLNQKNTAGPRKSTHYQQKAHSSDSRLLLVLPFLHPAEIFKLKQATILFFMLIFLITPVKADDREADLFDNEDIFLDDNDTQPSLVETISKSLNKKDKTLDIGGRFYYTASLFSREDEHVKHGRVANTGITDLYFDAILEDDLRFYYQQKFSNSVVEFEHEIVPLNLSQLSTSSDIDQLWLKFKLKERYYFTLGKQQLRLGPGFVWNTTDFINIARFNPLALTDQRLGVNLVKIQMPFSDYGINLYAIAQFDEAEKLEEMGTFIRMEYLTETAEYAISFNNRKNQALNIGFDISKGFSIVDLFVSLALIHNDPNLFYVIDEEDGTGPDTPIFAPTNPPPSIDRSDEWLKQISAGFIFSRNMFDNETLLINLELFYNEAGYENSDLMPFIIEDSLTPKATPENDSSFNPLYFNQYYAALSISLMNLGPDNDQSISALLINNFDDETGVGQLIYGARPFRDLSFSWSAGYFYGDDGTFHPNENNFSNPAADGTILIPPRFFTQIQLVLSF